MNTLALPAQHLGFKGLTSRLSVLEDSELDLGNSHNNPLPDDVQQLIRKELSDAEHYLASLDTIGIPSVDSLGDFGIDQPNFEYSDVARRIQSYRTAIAPHRKLPNEILLEIFLCSPPAHITTPPHSESNSGSHAKPCNLMHVCSKWRHLAFHLWRDVFVLYKSKEDLKRNAAFIEDVILCSGDPSISLIISVFDGCELRPKDVEKDISDLVIRVAGSFKSFTWVGNSQMLVSSLKFRPGSVELVGNVFKDAHTLRTFTIVAQFDMFNHSNASAISSSFPIRPWNHMTHLTFTVMNSIGSGEFLRLLYQCTNLLEFRGSIGARTYFASTAEFPSPPTVPILPNLKLLWIACPFSDVIPYLNVPNLTSFQLLDFNVYSTPEWNTRILSFFLRSNRLTHLTLKPSYGYQCIPSSTFTAICANSLCLFISAPGMESLSGSRR